MLVTDLKDLPKLLKICRKAGVSHFHQDHEGGLTVHFGDMPAPGSAAHRLAATPDADDDADDEKTEDAGTFPTLNDQEMAEYSVRTPE